jgi:hypothetical protein
MVKHAQGYVLLCDRSFKQYTELVFPAPICETKNISGEVMMYTPELPLPVRVEVDPERVYCCGGMSAILDDQTLQIDMLHVEGIQVTTGELKFAMFFTKGDMATFPTAYIRLFNNIDKAFQERSDVYRSTGKILVVAGVQISYLCHNEERLC